MASSNIQERLDRFVGNKEWSDAFPKGMVCHLTAPVYDHLSILLVHEWLHKRDRRRSNKRFFFESMWSKDEECEAIITEA